MEKAKSAFPVEMLEENQAVVKLVGGNGQGVIIPGELILTAAHLIEWGSKPAMGLDEPIGGVVEVSGEELFTQVVVGEVVADIAVLSCPNPFLAKRQAERYEKVISQIRPLPLAAEMEPMQASPVYIHTSEPRWVAAAAQDTSTHLFMFFTDRALPGGTPGGPIVDPNGHLVGVVSHLNAELSEGCTAPVARTALPPWAVTPRTRDAAS